MLYRRKDDKMVLILIKRSDDMEANCANIRLTKETKEIVEKYSKEKNQLIAILNDV